MFIFSIIVNGLLFLFNIVFGAVIAMYNPLLLFEVMLLMIPCFPMAIVALVGGIRNIKNPLTRKKGIITTVLGAHAILYFIVLGFLMAFAFGTGGRLPSPQLFGWW